MGNDAMSYDNTILIVALVFSQIILTWYSYRLFTLQLMKQIHTILLSYPTIKCIINGYTSVWTWLKATFVISWKSKKCLEQYKRIHKCLELHPLHSSFNHFYFKLNFGRTGVCDGQRQNAQWDLKYDFSCYFQFL